MSNQLFGNSLGKNIVFTKCLSEIFVSSTLHCVIIIIVLFMEFFAPQKIIREIMLQELVGTIKDVLDPISVNLIEIMPESIIALQHTFNSFQNR